MVKVKLHCEADVVPLNAERLIRKPWVTDYKCRFVFSSFAQQITNNGSSTYKESKQTKKGGAFTKYTFSITYVVKFPKMLFHCFHVQFV